MTRKINDELLERTMRHIEKNPEEHDQQRYVNDCGTAFCFAGHAAILNGAKVPTGTVVARGWDWGVMPDGTAVEYYDHQVESRHIEDHAADILGLDYEQSDTLFAPYRTRDELRLCVDALKADPDADLMDVLFGSDVHEDEE